MIIKLSPAHFNMFYFVFFMFGWKINASDEFVNCKIDFGIRPAPLNGDVQSQPGMTGPSESHSLKWSIFQLPYILSFPGYR